VSTETEFCENKVDDSHSMHKKWTGKRIYTREINIGLFTSGRYKVREHLVTGKFQHNMNPLQHNS